MSGDWQAGFGQFVIVIALGGVTVPCWESMVSAQQIIPDETLGAESSVVTPDNINGMESDRISGGATRGSNLFHSFREFNIGEDRGGYFENPAAIENIFSRVTGSDPSNILGTLGVLGNANLFFLNPNGILFGPNASLDVRGSFLATTADSILFPDERQFSAANPQAQPLLTVNVQQLIGLQFEGREGTISNQGILALDAGQNLALVGGDVTLDGGSLIAPGGRVELGGLSTAGEIGLSDDGSLNFPDSVARADVLLTNFATVEVTGDGGGSIAIKARNLELSESDLLAGIGFGLGASDAQAGNIELNTTELVSLDRSFIFNYLEPNAIGNGGNITIFTDKLFVTNDSLVTTVSLSEGRSGNLTVTASESVQVEGEWSRLAAETGGPGLIFTGNAGDLTIETEKFLVTEGAQVSTSTFSAGDGGDLRISASESVQVDDNSAVAAFAGEGLTGKAGDLIIKTGQLFVDNGAVVSTSTFSKHDGGNLTIVGERNGGNLTIEAGQLLIRNGSIVTTSTLGERDGGNLTISAIESVQVTGESSNGQTFSRLATQANPGSTGDAGNLTIKTEKLIVTDGAQLSARTFGQGDGGLLTISDTESVQLIGTSNDGQIPSRLTAAANPGSTGDAGNLTIETGKLIVTDGAELSASTFGQGDGGLLTINASESVQVIGIPNDGQSFSNLAAQAGLGNTGDAGNLTIKTGKLIVTDGAQLSVSTFGQGDGGILTINAAESVQVIGTSNDGQIPSRLATQANLGSTGKAGELNIETRGLFITDGAQLSAATFGAGNGGDLTISATESVINGGQLLTTTSSSSDAGDITLKVEDSINLAGESSGLFANTQEESSGKGGSIIIDPNTVIIRDGAQIAVNSDGSGIGGNINLQAGSLTLDKGTITAESASSQGGNINLTLSDLLTLRNNSQITATAGTTEAGGDGGNIRIDAPFIIALPQENSDISANAFEGDGGNITINTNGIFGIEFRERETPLSDITASSEFGQQGEVEINTSAIDPTRGLNNLPQDTVEAKVVEGCQTAGGQPTLEFFDIGRGGLPPSPDDLFSSETVIAEWIPLDLADKKIQAPTSEKSFTGGDIKDLTLLSAFPCQSN